MKNVICGLTLLICATSATAFELTSIDIKNGKPMTPMQEYKGMGCSGDNLSPALAWTNPPAGTRSYAITVFDPDAPTGSGWWHWVVYDIPASVTEINTGMVAKEPLPKGAKQGRNDFGERNFGGACPVDGDRPHRYVFTVHALSVDKLNVPEDATAARIGFAIQSHRLGLARMTTTYSRGNPNQQ